MHLALLRYRRIDALAELHTVESHRQRHGVARNTGRDHDVAGNPGLRLPYSCRAASSAISYFRFAFGSSSFEGRFVVRCLSIFVCSVVFAASALAQNDRGTITGTVQDQGQARVPNAAVTVTNSENA